MSLLLIAALRRHSKARRGAAVKRRLLVLLVVLLALALFAPTIALRTPLRGRVLARLAPAGVGQVTAERITAGWLTPVSASGVTMFDMAGNRLADIEGFAINRSLLALLQNSRDLGVVQLENPTVYTLVRPDGSTLEDLLPQPKISSSSPATAPCPPGECTTFRVEVTGGRLVWRDAATGATWAAESLAATVDHLASGELRISAAGFVRPAADNGAPVAATDGGGRFELQWGDNQQATQAARLVCQQAPLAAFEPWLKRFDANLRLAGEMTGEVAAAYPTPAPNLLTGNTNGRLTLAGLKVAATAMGDEVLELAKTDLAWKGSANGGRMSIENLSLSSDVAIFDVRGVVPSEVTRQLTRHDFSAIDTLTGSDIESEGRLHLARLAEIAPGLLQIRPGAKITDGQVRFTASNQPTDGGRKLTASITTTPLAGVAGGKKIEWDSPLVVDVVARRLGGDVRVDRLSCQSEFLSISGSGDKRQMNVDGRVDLDQLTRRLEQFVDLSDWRLTGRGELNATCRTDAEGLFTATGAGNLQNLMVAYRDDTLANEPGLNWQASVSGEMGAGEAGRDSLWPRSLASGQVSLAAGRDELTLQLTAPAPLGGSLAATDWPLKIVTTGQLTGWAQRLRPWVDLSAWQMSGDLDLAATGRIRATPLAVSLSESRLVIDSLEAVSQDWQIREPRAEWSGDLGWDSATGTLTSRGGKLLSSTLAATLRDWFWTADARQAQQVGGLAAVRMSLARLAKLRVQNPNEPAKFMPIGEVSGNVKLASQQGQVVAVVDLTGANVALQTDAPSLPGQPPTRKTVWQEPQLRVVGTVSYAAGADSLKFDGLQAQSGALALAASGGIDALSTTGRVNLAGTMDYDLATLGPILAQYVGEGLSITGREQAKFEVKGSLAKNDVRLKTQPPTAAGGPRITQASVPGGGSQVEATSWYARLLAPWQSASLYGLPVGQGKIAAELANGQVAIEPLDFEVGGGRFTAAPAIRLEPPPGELTLAPGRMLTDVHITPEVSEKMLKYILPPVAQATRAEGLFSMNLSGARIPLGDPAKADVAGQLAVQSVKVAPGPMVGEWVALAREIEGLLNGQALGAVASRGPVTLLSITDRTIDFRLVDGRVYHQGLEFQIGELVIRSRGSVGLDETLSIVLEFQIPEKWRGQLARVVGGGGTVIEIPVTGTFSHPRLERQAIGNILKQAVPGALNQLLGDEVGSALDKFFGGGRQ